MKKKIAFLLLAILAAFPLLSQDNYSKIAVDPKESGVIQTLMNQGITFDHYETLQDGTIAFFINQEERNVLTDLGVAYEVLIDNYRAYYQQLLQEDVTNILNMQRSSFVADGFDLGSMGGFYTLAEVEAKLDEMFANYPNLVTQKESIGTTFEGRNIWMVKISDNPNINENEPVAYFDAIHHAREPLAMATTINFMFWLLENYTTNEQVAYLVNNRELYFVPIVNPDGYFYNETTDPDGGGLWRKNRRVNTGTTCVGVDLNRNYGFGYATNNSCSSPDPCSGIYRGEEAFSEAESIAVRDFMSIIEPKTAFSTHSTAGSYLMPYGFDTNPPAFDIYSEWASEFLSVNNYPYGVTFQMLGYTSCGTTRDYMHSENIYGWTPEIDGQGFWPPPSTIFDLVSENVYPLFYQSWISGGYIDIRDYEILDEVVAGQSFPLSIEVKNVGLGDAANVNVRISTKQPEITILTDEATYGTVTARSRENNTNTPFVIDIPPSFSEGSFSLLIESFQDGVLNKTQQLQVFVGDKTVLFFDDAEAASNDWIATGNNLSWGSVSDDSFSGNLCYGDSNGGNGQNDTESFFELDTTFDFSNIVTPIVSFMNKYSIEINDRVELQISVDNGVNWEVLQTFTASKSWNQYFKTLQDYTGFSEVKFRFFLFTNGFIPADGFYFDDFEVAAFDSIILNTIENSVEDAIIVYPNPADKLLTLKNTSISMFKVDLFDISGRRYGNTTYLPNGNTQLDISKLKTGTYFLKIIDKSGKVFMKRFLKE